MITDENSLNFEKETGFSNAYGLKNGLQYGGASSGTPQAHLHECLSTIMQNAHSMARHTMYPCQLSQNYWHAPGARSLRKYRQTSANARPATSHLVPNVQPHVPHVPSRHILKLATLFEILTV